MTVILLVEDEPAIAEPLVYLLQREGYEVAAVADGGEALARFGRGDVDLVLLDLMLPVLPGTEVAKRIRAVSDVPIIMLTAKDAEIDIVLGLELGADDYVTKPYSSRELLARVRAVLRRRVEQSDAVGPDVLESGPIRLDAGRVLTRGQLIDRIWGSDYFGDTKTLDVHVKRIRAKIEEEPAEPRLLLTVRGLGYRFEDLPAEV
jgi:two-component system response regulator RegX3